jgi:hypothetical protein
MSLSEMFVVGKCKEQLRVFRLRCASLNMTVGVDMPAVLAEMVWIKG